MIIYKVSNDILNGFAKTGNLEKLQKNLATAFVFENEKFVYTGSKGDGTGKGFSAVWGYKAVLKEDYTDSLEPLYEDEHSDAVLVGARSRGYYARLVKINNVEHVLTQSVTFELDKS